jgi:hypothetical protein
VKIGLFFGKAFAVLGLLIAVIRTPGLLGSSYWWLPWVAVIYYLAAGVSAGVVVAVLFPLMRTLVGRLVVSVVAAYPVSIGAMLVGATVQTWPSNIAMDSFKFSMIMGPLAAIVLGLVFRRS